MTDFYKMKSNTSKLVLLLLSCLFYTGLFAKKYYVSASTGLDSKSGLSSANAYLTITKARDQAVPGDSILIMNGTYAAFSLGVANSGSSIQGKNITYIAYQGHTPKIYAFGGNWAALSINASYVVIDGIEFMGDNANLTYEGAMLSYNHWLSGLRDYTEAGIYNCNGVSIGGSALQSSGPTHVTIKNCKIHDFPGAGLSSIQADYTTFDNNHVYNNAWYMQWAGSGISILNPINSDQTSGYKNFVRGNICYNNKTTVPWIDLVPARLSDGNGIIIDTNQKPYVGGIATSQGAYTGRTLVANNVSYNNGGSGIHAFQADHVDIINNTAYNNGIVMGYADIYGGSSRDVNITNNVMYSRNGGKCNTNDDPTVLYDYNVYYNGTVNKKGTHDIIGNPNFVNLALDGTAYFHLRGSSPAINTGTNATGFYTTSDIEGKSRPWGTAPDRGAYEYSTIKKLQTISFNAIPSNLFGSADVTLSAIASSGLPVTFTSSNTALATITGNTLHVLGSGSAVITASQAGNATFDEAPDVNQTLTVQGANIITNPTFDTDVSGWTTYLDIYSGFTCAATFTSIVKSGYSGKAAKIAISVGGNANWMVQLAHIMPLEAGKTYSIKFKASADANRTINYALQQDISPKTTWQTSSNINLTTTPTIYGPYYFNASTTDATNKFKFILGNSTISVYIDDVEVKEIAAPEMNVKQGSTYIADNTGTYSFGSVEVGSSVLTAFTIENLGTSVLNLTNTPRVTVTGTGFSLVPLNGDADSYVNAGSTTTFSIKFTPVTAGVATGTISIANNDLSEGTYNFTISGTALATSITNVAATNSDINAYGLKNGVIITTQNPETYKIFNFFGKEIITGKCNGGIQFVPLLGKGIFIILIEKKAIKVYIPE